MATRTPKPKTPTFKPVKSAAAQAKLADKWFALRAQRLAEKKVMEQTEAQEKAAKAALIQSMRDNEIGAIGGKTIIVKYETDDKPRVDDWVAVWKWAKKHDAMDIYQRRITDTAVEARWEQGEKIPGISTFPVDKLTYESK